MAFSTARRARAGASSWEESKRKVRDLVLAELAPKMNTLAGAGLTIEVKEALDRILQREEVRVSPSSGGSSSRR